MSDLIYLCGFMGSGKSTIGRILARMKKVPFYDLDEIIETNEKNEITNIFKEKGEEHFRNLEKKYLESFDTGQPAVLALGGGTVCNEINLRFVKSSGVLIFLKPTVDIISKRLSDDKSRPMLRDEHGHIRNEEELTSFITNLYTKRLIWYEQAHYIIKINKVVEPSAIASRILSLVK
ncbi:MAG TPA: shikimate kinase [Balneolales bacterium]|nr:shikimate kinase [Balneolales bacterium]